MKITSSILAATATLLALVACQKEEVRENTYPSDSNAVIVNATLQGAASGNSSTPGANTAPNTAPNTGANTPTTRVNTESTGDAFVTGEDFFHVRNTTAGADATQNMAYYTYAGNNT